MPPTPNPKPSPDILIAGAGIIGLSLALELHHRGARVTILERDTALTHASTAAAGMLAVNDPHNPPALLPLSQLSASLYPAFLQRIHALSNIAIPFQTHTTLQHLPNGSIHPLAERSIDPRQLATALIAAIRATSIDLREHTPFHPSISAGKIVFATGAWSFPPITPRKGQMLRVQLNTPLHQVHRNADIYIVPRTTGPQAGTAIIGSTLEDAGFDTTTHQQDLTHLHNLATHLLPSIANATQLDAWAGLRPATPDELPILGPIDKTNRFLATGHFRNGILLAPATAIILAGLLESKSPTIDLAPFSPARFSLVPTPA